MGRKERRKDIRNHVNKNNTEDLQVFKFSSFIKTVIGFFVILLVFYFILATFVTKEINLGSDKSFSDSNNTNSVSNQILASNTFLQQEDSYYVYFDDFNKEDEKLQSSISSLSDGTVYRVNTSDGLNSNYVSDGDKGNSNALSLQDLKVINPTLIRVSNDKIVSYYEGVSGILSFLNK